MIGLIYLKNKTNKQTKQKQQQKKKTTQPYEACIGFILSELTSYLHIIGFVNDKFPGKKAWFREQRSCVPLSSSPLPGNGPCTLHTEVVVIKSLAPHSEAAICSPMEYTALQVRALSWPISKFSGRLHCGHTGGWLTISIDQLLCHYVESLTTNRLGMCEGAHPGDIDRLFATLNSELSCLVWCEEW